MRRLRKRSRLPLSPAPKASRTPAGQSADSVLTVRRQSAAVASTLLGVPGVTASDSRPVRARGHLPGLYRQFAVWMGVAASLTDQPPYC